MENVSFVRKDNGAKNNKTIDCKKKQNFKNARLAEEIGELFHIRSENHHDPQSILLKPY